MVYSASASPHRSQVNSALQNNRSSRSQTQVAQSNDTTSNDTTSNDTTSNDTTSKDMRRLRSGLSLEQSQPQQPASPALGSVQAMNDTSHGVINYLPSVQQAQIDPNSGNNNAHEESDTASVSSDTHQSDVENSDEPSDKENDLTSSDADSVSDSVSDSDSEYMASESGTSAESSIEVSSDESDVGDDENNHQIIIIRQAKGREDIEGSEGSESSEESSGRENENKREEEGIARELGGILVAILGRPRIENDFNPVNDRESFLKNIGFEENDLDPASVAKADELWKKCVDYHQAKLDQLLGVDLESLSDTLAKIYFDEKVSDTLKRQVVSACKDVKSTILELKADHEIRKNTPSTSASTSALNLELPISSSDLARHTRTIMQAQELLGKAGYGGIIDAWQVDMESGLQVHTNSKKEGITFADVAGISEAKAELQEIVDYLKNPDKYTSLGAKIPRGVLLSGSPGTGKTLLAKAVAGEAGVPFFSVAGSSFVEEYVGTGAKRVRDLFSEASKHKSCIIFIDEIDAVGRARNAHSNSGSEEHEHTLNALLVAMDGFDPRSGVIVMGATNRPDILDDALMRPGRFDRSVNVPLPNPSGREEILRLHCSDKPIAPDVNFNSIARRAIGYSGADLANLANEASIHAGRDGSGLVCSIHFEQAKDKIELGHENRSLILSRKNLENTAYHEAGHAIVAYLMPEHDEVHKVTIVPRGFALGLTHFTPSEDDSSISHLKLKSELATLMGGRIAEELLLGKDGITTGASNDLERASALAHKMVREWGFSDKVGRIVTKRNRDGSPAAISQETAKLIDDEVKVIIDEAEATARGILTQYKSQMDAMALSLLDKETIDESDVLELLKDLPKGQGFNLKLQSLPMT